jgi:dTDP-4-dehydrorhamnose reductase
VRTSWLYGKAPQKGKPRGKNFIDTILYKAKAGEELRIVDDQFGRPTYAKDLSHTVKIILEKKYETGTFQVTNQGQTSWYGLAQEALRITGVSATINPCRTSDFPAKAARPIYSLLNNNKVPKLRTWQDALASYLNNE